MPIVYITKCLSKQYRFEFSYSFPCHRIEIETKIYKTNEHPEVAKILSSIAQNRSNLGEYQRAIEEFEKVLGKRMAYMRNQNYA